MPLLDSRNQNKDFRRFCFEYTDSTSNPRYPDYQGIRAARHTGALRPYSLPKDTPSRMAFGALPTLISPK